MMMCAIYFSFLFLLALRTFTFLSFEIAVRAFHKIPLTIPFDGAKGNEMGIFINRWLTEIVDGQKIR